MVLDLGGNKGHGATNVCDLQPLSGETFGGRTLRENPGSALVHHLRDEFMRIEQRPTDRGEQRTCPHTPRIMTYIRDDPRFITAEFCACDLCESFDSYHGFTTTAGMFWSRTN